MQKTPIIAECAAGLPQSRKPTVLYVTLGGGCGRAGKKRTKKTNYVRNIVDKTDEKYVKQGHSSGGEADRK